MTVDQYVTAVTKANEELAANLNSGFEKARGRFTEILASGAAVVEETWPASAKVAEGIAEASKGSFEAAQRVAQLGLAGNLVTSEGSLSVEGKRALSAATAWLPSYFNSVVEYQKLAFQWGRAALKVSEEAKGAALVIAEESSAQAAKYAETCLFAWGQLLAEGVEGMQAAASGKSPLWYDIPN